MLIINKPEDVVKNPEDYEEMDTIERDKHITIIKEIVNTDKTIYPPKSILKSICNKEIIDKIHDKAEVVYNILNEG